MHKCKISIITCVFVSFSKIKLQSGSDVSSLSPHSLSAMTQDVLSFPYLTRTEGRRANTIFLSKWIWPINRETRTQDRRVIWLCVACFLLWYHLPLFFHLSLSVFRCDSVSYFSLLLCVCVVTLCLSLPPFSVWHHQHKMKTPQRGFKLLSLLPGTGSPAVFTCTKIGSLSRLSSTA